MMILLIDPGHYPTYSKISMRGLAKVSLSLKWGLWKVACDAFPLCCAALDPDNDSWERWGGPAQLDPNDATHNRPMIPCWIPETDWYFWHVQALKCIEFQICGSVTAQVCTSTVLQLGMLTDAVIWRSARHHYRLRHAKDSRLIDLRICETWIAVSWPSMEPHICSWSWLQETYEQMHVYLYIIYLHLCVVRRDWNYQWICT